MNDLSIYDDPVCPFETSRFWSEQVFRMSVQLPQEYCEKVLRAVLSVSELRYGDYDHVSFESQPGMQRFRSRGTGRNIETHNVLTVPCVELSFLVGTDPSVVTQVLEAIYSVHPYEEPVICVEQCCRARHRRGVDEDNPNRFWNAAPADWVPKEHR